MNEFTKAGLMIMGCGVVLFIVWLAGYFCDDKTRKGKGIWF